MTLGYDFSEHLVPKSAESSRSLRLQMRYDFVPKKWFTIYPHSILYFLILLKRLKYMLFINAVCFLKIHPKTIIKTYFSLIFSHWNISSVDKEVVEKLLNQFKKSAYLWNWILECQSLYVRQFSWRVTIFDDIFSDRYSDIRISDSCNLTRLTLPYERNFFFWIIIGVV
jgi:hypothetical protein